MFGTWFQRCSSLTGRILSPGAGQEMVAYSANSAYTMLQQGNTGFEGAKRIWRTWAPPKIKFFICLASRQRL